MIPQPQSPKQEMMLNSKAKITIVGGAAGSGKSFIMTMHPLQHIHDPNFDAIFFRRNTTQVTGQGGLYDTAKSMYMDLPKGVKPKFRERDLKAIFPSGASIKWNHMEHENDRFSHQGLQYSAIYFDEGKLPRIAVMLYVNPFNSVEVLKEKTLSEAHHWERATTRA